MNPSSLSSSPDGTPAHSGTRGIVQYLLIGAAISGLMVVAWWWELLFVLIHDGVIAGLSVLIAALGIVALSVGLARHWYRPRLGKRSLTVAAAAGAVAGLSFPMTMARMEGWLPFAFLLALGALSLSAVAVAGIVAANCATHPV
jgi:hypothetical protein